METIFSVMPYQYVLIEVQLSSENIIFFFLYWQVVSPFYFFLLAVSTFFFFNFIYLWLCWVFVSVRGRSLVVASGGHSSSWCTGLSLSWPLVAEHRLQTRRLSNCGSRAQLLRGMWDLPRPGLEENIIFHRHIFHIMKFSARLYSSTYFFVVFCSKK